MADTWQLQVYENRELVFSERFSGPVEIGRQSNPEEALYSRRDHGGRSRVVIAAGNENAVSRTQAKVEPLDGGRVRITNLSTKQAVALADGSEIKPYGTREAALPAELYLGTKVVRVQVAEPEEGRYQCLPEATLPPGSVARMSGLFPTLSIPAGSRIEPQALLRWLHAAMGVFQSAASSADFFAKAAQGVVDLVGLDAGRVLLLHGEEWETLALQTGPRLNREKAKAPSRRILSRVLEEKRTFWQVLDAARLGEGGSLQGVTAVVAAPILDPHGTVLGALYGDRLGDLKAHTGPITEIEAMLVELLATGVAAGLARLEQEKAALKARIQFEQFFTPELSHHLTAQPDLLKGRSAEITILFADIRGFSHISERLGPEGTVSLVNEFLGHLSDCVREQQGVLVDYIGDELMAMWGAPDEQADHPALACRAALAMLERLPAVNARWQSQLERPLALGIGINTGQAWVGNTGSRHKFKYGPLGHTVNLASRVQGATKFLRTNLLITGSTRERLDLRLPTRRVCTVRVINIANPLDLFELPTPGVAGWDDLKRDYEEALKEFEARQFRPASRIVGKLLSTYPDDGPSLVLLARAVNALIDGGTAFDPVWELPGK
jgi:adenylate cyclase